MSNQHLIIFLFPLYCITLYLQPLENALSSLYVSNIVLDQTASSLCQSNPTLCHTQACPQDPSLQYLHLGPNTPPQAIIMCNIHAREAITADICLEWAKQYMTGDFTGISVNVLYNANRNRDEAVVKGNCERKSKTGTNLSDAGVDLNRNFETEFNFYRASKSSEIYPGPEPFSEPLSKCIEEMIDNSTLLFVDIHSGENNGLFYQQGYNSKADREILQIVNEEVWNSTGRVTTLARDLEAINGHIFADLKVRRNMKYSLLIESYGDSESKDCLTTFNPTTKEKKDRTINGWIKGLNVIFREFKSRERL